MANDDLVTEFKRLEKSIQNARDIKTRAEAALQAIQEQEAALLQEMKAQFNIDSVEQLETFIKKEEQDLRVELNRIKVAVEGV